MASQFARCPKCKRLLLGLVRCECERPKISKTQKRHGRKDKL